ncbi:TPA: hypothetical protein U2C09_000352 [Streptococcus suis]|nr:hypothetical protein [Streptococcus suis]
MRKDNQMETRVTKNGYKYQFRNHEMRRTKELKNSQGKHFGISIGKALLTGIKNLPWFLMRAVVLMVTTPLTILLFLFNLIKSLFMTAIAWFIFKVIVGFSVIGYYAFFTKEGTLPNSIDIWFENWIMPNGVPIFHWWETTIIVILAVITALSLTLHPQDA